MKITSITIDLVQLLLLAGVILLMVGTIPFTAVSVGVLFLISMCELKFSWS